MNPKKVASKAPSRFDKIVKHIAEKASPTDNSMAIEHEADAIAQNAKKLKPKRTDLAEKDFR